MEEAARAAAKRAEEEEGDEGGTADDDQDDDDKAGATDGGTATAATDAKKDGEGGATEKGVDEGDEGDDGSWADDEGDGEREGTLRRSLLWRVRDCVRARGRRRVGVTPGSGQEAAAGSEADAIGHHGAGEGDPGGMDQVDDGDNADDTGVVPESKPAEPDSPRTLRIASRRAENQRVIDSRPRDGIRWFRAWRALTRPVLTHPSVEPESSAAAVKRPWSRALRDEDEAKLSKEVSSRVLVPEKRMNLIGSHGVLRLPFLSTVAFAAARAIGGQEWCRHDVDRVRACCNSAVPQQAVYLLP